MNETPESRWDPRYLAGIEHFNDCDFFEAHEAWEELWADYQGPSRTFYQGLIQVAVCLHHFVNENTGGSRKLYYSSRKYLEEFLPWHEGVNVEKLLAEMEHCCRKIIASEEKFPQVTLVVDEIPEIHLEESPEAG